MLHTVEHIGREAEICRNPQNSSNTRPVKILYSQKVSSTFIFVNTWRA